MNARQLPRLSDEQGVNRKLPHLGDSGKGVNRATEQSRSEFIADWFAALHNRMRDVRVAVGDWTRVLTDSVTIRHGLTGVFLDPPYTKGSMDYASGGVGGDLANRVREWCVKNGNRKEMRIVLCGHAGEHDELLDHGWSKRKWKAKKGYALTDEARKNTTEETLWCNPHCLPDDVNCQLFLEM